MNLLKPPGQFSQLILCMLELGPCFSIPCMSNMSMQTVFLLFCIKQPGSTVGMFPFLFLFLSGLCVSSSFLRRPFRHSQPFWASKWCRLSFMPNCSMACAMAAKSLQALSMVIWPINLSPKRDDQAKGTQKQNILRSRFREGETDMKHLLMQSNRITAQWGKSRSSTNKWEQSKFKFSGFTRLEYMQKYLIVSKWGLFSFFNNVDQR